MRGLATQPRVGVGATRITTTGLALVSSGFGRTATAGQNFRAGNSFALAKAARLIGIRFGWKLANEATPESVSVDAHDANGTLLESYSKSVTASGEIAIYLTSSYAIAAWSRFTLSTYGTTNAYVKWTLAGLPSGLRAPAFGSAYSNSAGLYLGGGVTYLDGYYVASDAYPNTRNDPTAQMFAVDPILDID